jgi:hypothetical protein
MEENLPKPKKILSKIMSFFVKILKWLFNYVFIVFFIGLLLWSANKMVEEKIHANNLLFSLSSEMINIADEQIDIKANKEVYKYCLNIKNCAVLPTFLPDTNLYNSLNSDDIALLWAFYRSWDFANYYQDVKHLKELYELQNKFVLELRQMPSETLLNEIATQRDRVIEENNKMIDSTNLIMDKNLIKFNFLYDNYNEFRDYIGLHFKALKSLVYNNSHYAP